MLECDHKAATQAVSEWSDSGLVVRVVRGRKMRTAQGLFDEFAAALQFPWYIGENAYAFDECITDLGWLPPQPGYVIVISDPCEVLVDAGADALAYLVDSLTGAAEEWSGSRCRDRSDRGVAERDLRHLPPSWCATTRERSARRRKLVTPPS